MSGFPRSGPATYDTIGRGYARARVPDPRLGAHIWRALADARRICNVGAGTGSYEPTDREVVAVEPSQEMIAQRSAGRVVRARAEALPFSDRSFDAVTAILTVHHWQDLAAGMAELRRVAALRVVFTFDPTRTLDFWLARDYLPEVLELDMARIPRIETQVELLGGADISVVPIPWDCTDGFQAAYWRRPQRYLEPRVQAGISTFAMLPPAVVERALDRLGKDLASGAWLARNAELLGRDEVDYGYRLLVSHERG